MKLIIGLGNPGEEYARTRHNIGRRVVEFIAAREKAAFHVKKSLQAAVATTQWNGETVHLVYPLTYMNLSGEAAVKIVKHFEVRSFQDLLVIIDDIALPFGKFRLRKEGSSGGHNGLASIECCLESSDYPRLRIGTGAAGSSGAEKTLYFKEPLREYVLSVFDPQEEQKMENLLATGMKACRSWVSEPITRAMNWINASELS